MCPGVISNSPGSRSGNLSKYGPGLVPLKLGLAWYELRRLQARAVESPPPGLPNKSAVQRVS